MAKAKVTTNVQAIVKGRVLGTSVDGGFVKDGDTTKVILYGQAEGDQGFISLKQLIDGISSGFGSDSDPEEQKVALDDEEKQQLSEQMEAPFAGLSTGKDEEGKSTSILDTIKVKLALVYLFKSTTKGAQPQTASSLKYALHVTVDMSNLINAKFPVDVDAISLKIWSSNVPTKIRDEMKITELQSLIDSASGTTSTETTQKAS
jgi:hypothetical protein